MLYRNLYIENAAELRDIRVENGKFAEIGANLAAKPGEDVRDFGGCLALPPLIESHVHLDTCLTAGDPVWNESGTLFEGIECWALRKEKLTKADVRERVNRAVRLYAASGVQYIRTHVDVTDPKLTAMEALLELRDELKDVVTLQIVAFPQEGIESYPNGRRLMEDAVRMGADCVGAIPHFEFTREYSVSSLNFAVSLAEKYDKLVDVHCDEIDDEASRGLETLAARAYETGLADRVTASHTTAMHSYNNAYVQRLMRLLKLSRINFVSNPLVNTHLQGRVDTYPKRRGVTRVRELTEAGINVSFGPRRHLRPVVPDGHRFAARRGFHGSARVPDDGLRRHHELLQIHLHQRRQNAPPRRFLRDPRGQPGQLHRAGREKLLRRAQPQRRRAPFLQKRPRARRNRARRRPRTVLTNAPRQSHGFPPSWKKAAAFLSLRDVDRQIPGGRS